MENDVAWSTIQLLLEHGLRSDKEQSLLEREVLEKGLNTDAAVKHHDNCHTKWYPQSVRSRAK
eukprot:766081-Hanusia_phi.AAC.4